jgi:hypothetical protein
MILAGFVGIVTHQLPPTSFWRQPKGVAILAFLFLSLFGGWKYAEQSEKNSETDHEKWKFAVTEEEKTGSTAGYCTYLAEYEEKGIYSGQAEIKCHPQNTVPIAAAEPAPVADAAAPAPAADEPAADAAAPAADAAPEPVAEVSTDPNCVGDCVNGFGTYTFASGDKYEGEFKDGKYNGQGTLTFASGDKYVGEWKDNKENGQGIYTSTNGDKYEGEFKDSKYNGQGTYIVANGDKYVGEMKDNEYNGQGTYTFANGTVWSGLWVNHEFMGAK